MHILSMAAPDFMVNMMIAAQVYFLFFSLHKNIFDIAQYTITMS